MLDKNAQTGKHTNQNRGLDLYETPPEALAALLKALPVPRTFGVWEPAAGKGSLVRELTLQGFSVFASDIVDYGYYQQDFLTSTWLPAYCQIILTNPPYQWAEDFVRHALKLKPKLAIFLLRLAFLESVKRTDILEHMGLAHIFVFRNRLPMMHRDGWDGNKAASAMPFAWFVWQTEFNGIPTLSRISWEKGLKT